MIIKYVFLLIIAVNVEFLIARIFVRRNPLKLYLCVLLINAFTYPIATYLYLEAINNFFVLELLIFMYESVLLTALLEISYSKAQIISFSANFTTALIGILVSSLQV